MKSTRLCAVAVLLAVPKRLLGDAGKAGKLLTTMKASASLALLMTLIVFSGCSMLMPQARASSGIIYSDAEDGGVANFGAVSSAASNFFVGDLSGSSNNYYRGFVKFSLSGISGTLASATLNLYVEASRTNDTYDSSSPLTNPGLGDCLVRHIGDYGTLDAGDFSTSSIGNDPSAIIGGGATPNTGYISTDITAAMQDDLNNGRPYTSFMIKLALDTDNDGREDDWSFATMEYAGTERDPHISYNLGAGPHSVYEFDYDVLNASSNTAWYVLGDYVLHSRTGTQFRSSAPKGSPLVAAIATDIFAAQYFYGGLSNAQNVILDTESAYISQAAGDFGNATGISGGTIVTVGGPSVNQVVYYYMFTTDESQLWYDSAAGAIKRRDTGATVTSEGSSWTSDVFVVESFVDAQGRVVYMFWGKVYLGTMAATCFMMEVLMKPTNPYGNTSWFVVRWNEATSGASVNGMPDAGDTYTVIQSGPPL